MKLFINLIPLIIINVNDIIDYDHHIDNEQIIKGGILSTKRTEFYLFWLKSGREIVLNKKTGKKLLKKMFK